MTEREIKDALLKLIGLGKKPMAVSLRDLNWIASSAGIDPNETNVGFYVRQLVENNEVETLYYPIYGDCGTIWVETYFLPGRAEEFLDNLQEAFDKSPAAFNYRSPVNNWRRSNPNKVNIRS